MRGKGAEKCLKENTWHLYEKEGYRSIKGDKRLRAASRGAANYWAHMLLAGQPSIGLISELSATADADGAVCATPLHGRLCGSAQAPWKDSSTRELPMGRARGAYADGAQGILGLKTVYNYGAFIGSLFLYNQV